jgi:hypothetical protein
MSPLCQVLAEELSVGPDDEERIAEIVGEATNRGHARLLQAVETGNDPLQRGFALVRLVLQPTAPLVLALLERDDLGARLGLGLAERPKGDAEALGVLDVELVDAAHLAEVAEQGAEERERDRGRAERRHQPGHDDEGDTHSQPDEDRHQRALGEPAHVVLAECIALRDAGVLDDLGPR